ncbi:uncharacterized protein A1O9_10957 [Exophiala aquamarina CBS 119918]|uniref:C2H2-type domain-containing protein n=1 Tax=Exophiala aquamarina CBS 119918 TaxID=1182545 RepID=A0A072NYU5_9EURO|nr:uncharacterized protein A1O9_10957 [Exophiala aquamarina CBS 119918]KEF53049.1 hypothetical protein A1O9_10957 [Exophiala aquamarina CBS 119918]
MSAQCYMPLPLDTNLVYPYFFSSDDAPSPSGRGGTQFIDDTPQSSTFSNSASSPHDRYNLANPLSPSTFSPTSSSSDAISDDSFTNPQSYKCELCPREFPRLNYLRRHQKSHDGPFQCDHCHKDFEKRRTWRNHQRVHNPFHKTIACTRENCHRVYQRVADYNRHVEFGHGNRKHEKHYCGPEYMGSKDSNIPKAGTTPMRKGGTLIQFDTTTQPLSQTPERRQQEPFSPPSTTVTDDTGEAELNLVRLLHTTAGNSQTVFLGDARPEIEYLPPNFALPEGSPMAPFYNDTSALGIFELPSLDHRFGMDNSFDGIEMNGFNMPFEAQMNLYQVPAPLLADGYYPDNTILFNNIAADLDQGGADVAMRMSCTYGGSY